MITAIRYREMILAPEGRIIRSSAVRSLEFAEMLHQSGFEWTDEECARWMDEGVRPERYHDARSKLLALLDAEHDAQWRKVAL